MKRNNDGKKGSKNCSYFEEAINERVLETIGEWPTMVCEAVQTRRCRSIQRCYQQQFCFSYAHLTSTFDEKLYNKLEYHFSLRFSFEDPAKNIFFLEIPPSSILHQRYFIHFSFKLKAAQMDGCVQTTKNQEYWD